MSGFKEKVAQLQRNPLLVQEAFYAELERQLGSEYYDVPDASSPFAWLMESNIINTSSALSEMEVLIRGVYPDLAMTPGELYNHMSDDDYIGRFASPVWSQFQFIFSLNEVISRAVDIGDGSGIRKLIIPRYTSVVFAETSFTMQYPIEIRVMPHGGLQVVYDTTDTSAIQTLESNLVEHRIVRHQQDDLLVLNVAMGQFSISTYTETLNSASGFNTSFDFADSFYYARVYLSNGSGVWTEINTTHSDLVYDIAKPTALLQVNNQSLNIQLPIIYFQTGAANRNIRIDIYTTKGSIELNAGAYTADQFEATFNDIDDDKTFTAPLSSLNGLSIINGSLIAGGADAVPFTTLRERVIDNAMGRNITPITDGQVNTELESMGYSLVTNVDNITDRQFLASRDLPIPDNDLTASPIGCMMGQFITTVDELSLHSGSIRNGQRLTLTPSMLYELEDGLIRVVSDSEIMQILSQVPDGIARTVNSRRFLYSPLYYVLDSTAQNLFDVRPYHLDSPVLSAKSFVSENATAQYQVSIDGYDIEKTVNGYRITLSLTSGEAWKNLSDESVGVQLTYLPNDEGTHAAVMGVLVDVVNDERVYTFDIETNYDLDVEGNLRTTNFTMFDSVQNNFYIPLDHTLDVHFIVYGAPRLTYVASDLDAKVQDHLLANQYMVISCERLEVKLGTNLDALWRRNRTVIGPESYQRHPVDVPYIYDTDGPSTIDFVNGEPVFTYSYRAGDAKLDESGNPVMRWLAGDAVLDGDGNPVLLEARKLNREITLFMVDGKYFFATDQESIDYRNTVADTISGWIGNDLSILSDNLLDGTKMYLYPTGTMGDTVALVRESQNTTVTLEQYFYVNYYVSKAVMANRELREQLEQTTRAIVNEMLSTRKTVSISDIQERLKANGGNDIISIEAGGLGGDRNFPVMTITDNAVRLSLRKRLYVLANQLLAIQDDIDIGFKKHQLED